MGRRVREQNPEAAVLYRQINSFNQVTRHTLRGSFKRYSAAQLDSTNVSVVFIAGSEDVLFPLDAIRLISQSLANSELVEIPDTGHSAFFESPEPFNQALINALLNIQG